MTTATDSALDALASINQQELRSEIRNLRAIRDWALANLRLDYQPGDRVVITSEDPSTRGGGWSRYSEALAPGQTGIAGEITFSEHSQNWSCLVAMDRCWSTSENPRWDGPPDVTRYWKGPASETPDGYEPPSDYERRQHPTGRTKHFAMNVHWLAKAPTDSPGPVTPATREARDA